MGEEASVKVGDAVRIALKRAIEEQREFEEQRSTRLSRGVGSLTAPIGGLIGRLIPPAVFRKGLEAADWAAGISLPSELIAHDIDDITACDAAALRVQVWSQGLNAATGGLAGWFGAAGLTADIPSTLGLAARNVRATGAAYGFVRSDEYERCYRLLVLEVATTQAGNSRREAISRLNSLAKHLDTPEGRAVLDHGVEWVSQNVVERIARQLGVSFSGRKLGQVVPIMGGVVAALVNASFQVDVSRSARYAFRQRWLNERRAIPEFKDKAE